MKNKNEFDMKDIDMKEILELSYFLPFPVQSLFIKSLKILIQKFGKEGKYE